jgi:hypothetical protein
MLPRVMDIARNIPIDIDLVENCIRGETWGTWSELRLRGEVPIGTGDRLVVVDTGFYPLNRRFLNLTFALPKDRDAFIGIGRGPMDGRPNRGSIVLYFMNPGNLVPHADPTRSFLKIRWNDNLE